MVAALVVCVGCGGESVVRPGNGAAGAGAPSSLATPSLAAAPGANAAQSNAPSILVMTSPPPASKATTPPPAAGGAVPGAAAGALPAAGAVPGAGAAPTDPAAAPGGPTAAAPPVVEGALGEPVIPEITGECPSLETGPINFMGADGQVESGPMPAEPTAPMLLYWHGTGSSAGEYAFMAAAIASGVTSQGGVIVSFQGTTNKGDCSPSGTFVFCTGDFEVMDQYVACAVKNRNVDPHRIYTAGCSAGGLMATAMAAQRSEYIAAASPNSGGLAIPSQFSSMHTPALMTVHGMMGSDVVVVDFAQTSATANMLWKQRGGFSIDCDTGGGHCGGGGLAGDAWKFMQAHPFGIDPEPWAGGLPADFSPQCKLQ